MSVSQTDSELPEVDQERSKKKPLTMLSIGFNGCLDYQSYDQSIEVQEQCYSVAACKLIIHIL